MKVPKIIAEIGCNHKGDMTIAKEMVLTEKTSRLVLQTVLIICLS